MPTYEYRCNGCDHQFEEFQWMSEEPLKKCPECGKNKLTRLFGTGSAVLFKGSGFYQTDYRSESYKSAAKADQPSTSTESKESTSKESTSSKASTPSKPDKSSSKST